MLPMYLAMHKSSLGAQTGLREFVEHASEVGPRWEEAEAGAPDAPAIEVEAIVSTVGTEESPEAPADVELAVACVGLR